MKIAKIINSSITNFNNLKFAKMSEDISGSKFSDKKSVADTYMKSNFFNNERGALKDSVLSLISQIKKDMVNISDIKNAANPDVKSKALTYESLLETPQDILAFKVDNPKVTAMSAQVKSLRGEEFFDFTLHGYFGDKRKFLINNEGEIIKTVSPKFLSKEKMHAYDADNVYYTQQEINNLGIDKYFGIFRAEMAKFKDHMLTPISPVETVKPQKQIDWLLYMYKQRETLDSIQRKFGTLYDGIIGHSRTSVQRKKLSQICGVKLHKKFPLIQLENINSKNESVLINFTQIGKKTVARMVVYNPQSKINRLFINGQLVEESPRKESNPFTVGRIAKFYTPQETDELKISELLNDINDKLSASLKQLRIYFGGK